MFDCLRALLRYILKRHDSKRTHVAVGDQVGRKDNLTAGEECLSHYTAPGEARHFENHEHLVHKLVTYVYFSLLFRAVRVLSNVVLSRGD